MSTKRLDVARVPLSAVDADKRAMALAGQRRFDVKIALLRGRSCGGR